MKNSFKNKNLLVIVFEILVIALGILGITLATSAIVNSRSQTLLTVSEYGIDYVGEKEISSMELEPMSDELININMRENVIRLEFSLRGVRENEDNNLIYDVMMNEMNIDCSLLNKYTKWRLYKNGKLLSNGSLDPHFDGNVLSDSMRLTNIQEDLPAYNKDYDNYVLIFWISEACDDLETCELVDQSSIVNSKMNMKIFIALYSGAKKEFVRVGNSDSSCANKPILYDNMVAVTYKNGEFVVADSTNNDKDNLWYDYGNAKWANAVVVRNNRYNKVGAKINDDDILGYFVWIPRYRYKLWNVMDEVSDSYNAYDNGISIIFENGIDSVENKKIENDNYLTHPAFLDNLRGFWISKYELSEGNYGYRFVGNTQSSCEDKLDNYQENSSLISKNYSLGDGVISHMVTNLEWGAVAYLSHSKYGVCNGDGCSSIGINDSYISANNKQDTTTRNVYGVYDMAGGCSEYALNNNNIGSATSEVILKDGDTWYSGHGLLSDRDYLIRGGVNKGMFYFGDISMDSPFVTTRVVLSRGD